MSKPKDPFVFIHHVSDAIDDILKYRQDVKNLDELRNDPKTFDAIVRKLEIIGEAVNNLAQEFLQKYPEVDWAGPVGLRNVLTHEYFDLSLKIIWELIDKNLPVLKAQILKILEDENSA